MAVGLAAWRLGAGRARKEDPVQAGAGVQSGTRVPATTSPRASRCSRCTPTTPERFDRALASLEGGYDIESTARSFTPGPIVLDRIG